MTIDLGETAPWVHVEPTKLGGAFAITCRRCGSIRAVYLATEKAKPGTIAAIAAEHLGCKEGE